MYNIINLNGDLIGSTDELVYIKHSKNKDCFINANENDAQGICLNGIVYNLIGREPFELDCETILINKEDSSEKLRETININEQYDELFATVFSYLSKQNLGE